jgi:hypothetical protein
MGGVAVSHTCRRSRCNALYFGAAKVCALRGLSGFAEQKQKPFYPVENKMGKTVRCGTAGYEMTLTIFIYVPLIINTVME